MSQQQQQEGEKPHAPPTTTTPTPSEEPHRSDEYAPYPKLQPNDVAPPPLTETWTSVSIASKSQSPPDHPPPNPAQHTDAPSPIAGDTATTMPQESNPYVSPSPAPAPGSAVKSEKHSLSGLFRLFRDYLCCGWNSSFRFFFFFFFLGLKCAFR